MNTTLTIKNFRVFDENGMDVQISPVTILTGCNSSGKSSIVKSILLLDSFWEQAKRDHDNGKPIRLGKYKLDFSTYPNNLLGRYDKIVNSKSESKKITFAYTIYSLLLSKDVTVELVFNTDKNDELNNGYLESFTLSTEEGIIYSAGRQIKRIRNLNLIKGDAIKFMAMEYLILLYSGTFMDAQEGDVSDKELHDQKKLLQMFIDEIGEPRFRDIRKFMEYSDRDKIIARNCNDEVLLWTYRNSSYFYIPLVELLKDCQKESIESKINDEVFATKEVSKELQEAFGKIVKDFFASDCHTFGEYFCMKETRFMENPEMDPPSYHFHSRNPFFDDDWIPSDGREYFLIPQEYLSSYPRSAGYVQDDNGTRREIESPEEEAEIKKWLDTPVTFPILYEILMEVNSIYTSNNPSSHYTCYMPFNRANHYAHHVFDALETFVNDFILECMFAWNANISYVSSSRIDVKRLYPLDDTTDFAQLLQRYFEGKRLTKAVTDAKGVLRKKKNYDINSFTNRCLKLFGIGESLSFDVDKDGLGVKIFLHRNDETEDRLLADEGYGITQLVSIMLQIETAILSAKGEKHRYCFPTFGDGYDSLKFYFEQQTIAIEEPEIHLHPKYQSLLADMFVFAYKEYNIHFIIETHSEYLIRKMQLLVAKEEMNSEDVLLLYVYDPDENKRPDDEPQIKDIGICSDGYLNESFGSGFFDEASSLSRQLLK